MATHSYSLLPSSSSSSIHGQNHQRLNFSSYIAKRILPAKVSFHSRRNYHLNVVLMQDGQSFKYYCSHPFFYSKNDVFFSRMNSLADLYVYFLICLAKFLLVPLCIFLIVECFICLFFYCYKILGCPLISMVAVVYIET